jgi:DNA-binding MarR family transcriptional regulator
MDLISKFTKEITLLNLAFKQFFQTKLREHNIDLTFEMMQILYCLWDNDGVNQQEIANITAKDKASMTNLLDNLTKRNMVYRQEGTDRRNKLIFLTPEGKALKKKISPWIKSLHQTAKNNVNPQHLEELVTVMEKIRTNLVPC